MLDRRYSKVPTDELKAAAPVERSASRRTSALDSAMLNIMQGVPCTKKGILATLSAGEDGLAAQNREPVRVTAAISAEGKPSERKLRWQRPLK